MRWGQSNMSQSRCCGTCAGGWQGKMTVFCECEKSPHFQNWMFKHHGCSQYQKPGQEPPARVDVGLGDKPAEDEQQ